MADHTGDTTTNLKRPLGPTGETVRANIIRLRAYRRLGYTDLSERLKDLDQQIPPLGLRRIENGARRVDADDLFALAVALGVSPVTLLIPNADDGGEQVAATGIIEKCDAERLWNWVSRRRADRPRRGDDRILASGTPGVEEATDDGQHQVRRREFQRRRRLVPNAGEAQ